MQVEVIKEKILAKRSIKLSGLDHVYYHFCYSELAVFFFSSG